MQKRPALSTGLPYAAVAVIVLVATLAVPWLHRGTEGAAARAEVLLTAAYPTTPVPGLLIDLESVIDLRPLETTEPTTEDGTTSSCFGCQPAWVMDLPDRTGLLVLPQRGAFQGAMETDVLAVVLNLDGTERWRVAGERFREPALQECRLSLETTVCQLVTTEGDLTVLRLRTADGEILTEWSFPDTQPAGWTDLDSAAADLILLRDPARLVRYDLDTDRELWSLEIGSWGTGVLGEAWANPEGGHLIVSAHFTGSDPWPSNVWALVDPDSGELRWRTDDWLAAADGNLFEITDQYDGLSRLDDVGLPLWSVSGIQHHGWFQGDPLVVTDERLQRLDGGTGEVRWSAAWPDTNNSGLRIDEAAGTLTIESDGSAGSVVLDPASGLVLDRFDGSLLAADLVRRYVRLGAWGDVQVLRATDLQGTMLWELTLDELIPGDQPQITVVAGRLAVLSSSHLLLLEPA